MPVFWPVADCTQRRASGIGAGNHFWGTAEEHTRFLRLWANLLIQSGDISLFQKHLRLELSAVRQAAGLAGDSASKDSIQV